MPEAEAQRFFQQLIAGVVSAARVVPVAMVVGAGASCWVGCGAGVMVVGCARVLVSCARVLVSGAGMVVLVLLG